MIVSPHRLGEFVDRDEVAPQVRRHPVRTQRRQLRARQVSRPGDVVELWPAYEDIATDRDLRRRGQTRAVIDHLTFARCWEKGGECTSTRPAFGLPEGGSGRGRGDPGGAGGREDEEEQGSLLEAHRLAAARATTWIIASWKWAIALGIETYKPAPLWPQGRRDAQHDPRFFPLHCLLSRRVARQQSPKVRAMVRLATSALQEGTLVEHGFPAPKRTRQPSPPVRRVGKKPGRVYVSADALRLRRSLCPVASGRQVSVPPG